ncbi:hypothetical protein LJK87_05245 [Paenibacillus sp. P25]|nr:hypothetical protein LJK87_05245 [Paenibacillus sp. P25]
MGGKPVHRLSFVLTAFLAAAAAGCSAAPGNEPGKTEPDGAVQLNVMVMQETQGIKRKSTPGMKSSKCTMSPTRRRK